MPGPLGRLSRHQVGFVWPKSWLRNASISQRKNKAPGGRSGLRAQFDLTISPIRDRATARQVNGCGRLCTAIDPQEPDLGQAPDDFSAAHTRPPRNASLARHGEPNMTDTPE